MTVNPRIKFLNRNSKTALKVIEALEEFRIGKIYKPHEIKYYDNYPRLINFLNLYFPEMDHLGCGISRRVWKLNNKTVLKICFANSFSKYNEIELKLSLEYSQYVTKPYLHYQDKGLDILVSQKVRTTISCLPNYKQIVYKNEIRKISKLFEDLHTCNVGLIGKNIKVIDVGNGLR